MKLFSSLLVAICMLVLLEACQFNGTKNNTSYYDTTGHQDALTGGVKIIPIQTEKGTFNVWTKRVGNNPKIKVLLLHGGPGATHEYFECFDSYLPKEGIEYYYYDQLGSAYSDNPNDTSLWNVSRFVEEVETVRKALGLDSSNFFLLGHSWGGILAMEYALKYQQNLKGLIVSNMVPSIPDYMKYANEVLGPKLPKEILQQIKSYEAAGKFTDPKYLKIIEDYYYPEHVIRVPASKWPDPVKRAMSKVNYPLYLRMQGPSEFGVVGDAVLKTWDITKDLPKIKVPTLSIGGEFDTMDPKAMEALSKSVQHGTYLYCPNAAHMSMYDNPAVYFTGLIEFIKKTDKDSSK